MQIDSFAAPNSVRPALLQSQTSARSNTDTLLFWNLRCVRHAFPTACDMEPVVHGSFHQAAPWRLGHARGWARYLIQWFIHLSPLVALHAFCFLFLICMESVQLRRLSLQNRWDFKWEELKCQG